MLAYCILKSNKTLISIQLEGLIELPINWPALLSYPKKKYTTRERERPDEDLSGAELEDRVERLEGDESSDETRERGFTRPLGSFQLALFVRRRRRGRGSNDDNTLSPPAISRSAAAVGGHEAQAI